MSVPARLAPLLLLAACGAGAPEVVDIDVPAGPLTLVVLGSSTAAAFGMQDPADGWVGRTGAWLATLDPGHRVVNLAVPGYTTWQVLPADSPPQGDRPLPDPEHGVTAALAEHPDAIVVNLPSNDAALAFPVEETLANLHAVVDVAGAAGVPVWVTTSQPRALGEDGRAALRALRDRTLADFGARALDFWTPLAAADGTLLPAMDLGDGIHPSVAGHAALFEVVRAADLPAAIAQQPGS